MRLLIVVRGLFGIADVAGHFYCLFICLVACWIANSDKTNKKNKNKKKEKNNNNNHNDNKNSINCWLLVICRYDLYPPVVVGCCGWLLLFLVVVVVVVAVGCWDVCC